MRITASGQRVSARRLGTLCGVSMLAMIAASPAVAGTVLPSGGQIMAGQATIAGTANGVTVNQSSGHAIINWQNFSIGAGGTTQFNNGSGATLNRVTGGNLSQIDGVLNATGSVYLINPQGVVIGAGGKVITGGSFVASTRDVDSDEFMKGGALHAKGTSDGNVVNQGKIVSRYGDTILIGKSVSNSGTIRATHGTAGLAAGDDVILRPMGSDARISVSAGKGDVTNTGTIAAAQAEMNAAGGNVYAVAGNQGGISVSGVKSVGGRIWLTGGDSTEISGGVSATNADGSGGTIIATASKVTVDADANISASGTKGGTILIGGDRSGGNDTARKLVAAPVANAKTTTVAAGATISVDGSAGDGGSVVVWSDQDTRFAGNIFARSSGGNGGFIETSGLHLSVADTAYVNTLAPLGKTGNWLLDPHNITVATGGSAALTDGAFSAGTTSDITIAPATINAAAANVTLQADNDITITNAISMTNAVMLTLNAGRSILVNANITSRGGFTATINDGGANSADRDPGLAAFTMMAGTTISTAPTTAVAAGTISITTGSLTADNTGTTSLAANVGDITLAALNTSGFAGATTSAAGAITVTNAIGNIFSASSGTVTITANGATPSSGTSIAGGAGGTIQITATNGAIGSAATALGAISANGGAGRTTNANGGAGGAVTLTAGTNIFNSAIASAGGAKAGTGTAGTTGAQLVQATNGSITMTADALTAGSLTLKANAASGIVTIQSLSAATTMGIANSGSTLNLTAANLALVTAKTFNFGTAANTGGVIIGAIAMPTSIGNMVVTSGSLDAAALGAVNVSGNITGSTGNLTLNATAADVYLQSGTISVGTLAVTAATQIANAGTTPYTNAAGTVTLTAGTAAGLGNQYYGILSLTGTITAANLALNAQGLVYSGVKYAVTNMSVTGGGTFNLYTSSTPGSTTSTNTIGTLAANVTGELNVSNNANLIIGTVNGINGVTAGTFHLTFGSAKTLTQTQAITATTMTLIGAGAGTYTLTNSNNSIGTFGAKLATGTLSLSGVNGLTVAGALYDDNGNSLTTGITAAALTLNNTGTVSESGTLTITNGLELLGAGGNYQLTNTANTFATLAANTGTVNVSRASGAVLKVGTVNSTVGVTATGAVTLTSLYANAAGVTVSNVITAGSGATLTSAGGISVAANIAATNSSISLRPDSGGTGTATYAVAFSGGAKASTTGAGITSIYYNPGGTSDFSAYIDNVTGNGALRQYQYISTLQNLQDVANNLSGSYALNKDINASSTASLNGGLGFAPIGDATTAFTGSFDGLGHVISGLVINRPSANDVGLFGAINGATISNVILSGGSITGGSIVGAVVGLMTSGSISGSTSSASVTAAGTVAGGLAGQVLAGSIANSYATGNVTGIAQIGGLVGVLGGTVTQSYASGAVSASGFGGGLIGYLAGGSVTGSYWDTTTTGFDIHSGTGSGTDEISGGLTSAQFSTASNFSGWTFGTAAGGAGWVIVDADDTLNNAGGATGATRPILLSEASTTNTINSAHQLQLMALNLRGNYTLGSNIDMSETASAGGVWLSAGFVPIGYAATDGNGTVPADSNTTFAVTSANPFSGNFNGAGFTISNLTINRPTTDYVGLIGYAYNSAGNQIIKNVNLVGGSITGRDHVGAIMGGNRGFVDNLGTYVIIYLNDTTTAASISSAAVSGRDFVGGLYGSVESNYSYYNTSTGAVSGRDYVGGLVGWLNGGSGYNTDLRSSGAVSGRNNVGGMAGYYASNLYGLSYATGNVTATGDNVGGFIGYAYATIGSNGTYATGNVIGNNNVGGLVGANASQVTNSFATGTVTGVMNVGGLVGTNDIALPLSAPYVDFSFATGAVYGVTNVGGLVGYNTNVIGAINNSGGNYATGAVYGTTNVGGLVGSNIGDSTTTYGRISTSYATGYVSGTTNVGGLVGNSTVSGATAFIKTSYFDSETTGKSNALGTGTSGTGGLATTSMPKTTVQLQAALQTSFSSSVWGVVANTVLPYFKWLYSSAPQVVSGTAYSDRGTTALAGATVNLLVSGLSGTTALTSAASAVGSSGANGYYYFLVPSGTFATAGKQVLAYDSTAATFNEKTTASLTGLNLYGTYFKEQAASTTSTLSALTTDLALAVNSNATATSVLASLVNREIDATAALTLDQGITTTGTLVLSGTGAWTQSASINATNLLLLGTGGSFTLTGGNAIGTLAANTGTVNVSDSGSITIGTVAGTAGVTTTGAATVSATGDLTIAASAKVTAGANSNVALAATGNFINNRGSDAITVSGTGRWLVYSAAPGTDTFGSLNSSNTAIWNGTLATLPPGTVTQTGNRYIFAQQPTLTISSANASKTYGVTADLSSNYNISGYQAALAGVYLGDNAASVFSGAPLLSSAGSAATAHVTDGPFAISIGAGTMTALNGYAFNFQGTGQLTITPRAITVAALSGQGKIYGDIDPTIAYQITSGSLVNGDGLSGALTRAVGDDVGNYAITAGSLAASSDYALSYSLANTFGISPATLTITAGNKTKTYGDTVVFAGTEFSVDGLKYSDGVSSISLASDGAAATATVNGGTPYAIIGSNAVGTGLSNYTIHYVDGGLTINPASLTITASNASKTYGDTLSFLGTEFTYDTLLNGDAITSVSLSSAGAAGTATVNGGTPYAITASNAVGSGLSNYDIHYVDGSLTLTRAPLTVTANNLTKTYGTLLTFTGTEFSTNGLLNNDTVTSAAFTSVGANFTATVNGGVPYVLGVTGASGTGLSNYTINYALGSVTVTPAALTITANNATKTYGDTLGFAGTEFSTDGLVNNDSVTSVSLTSSGAAATGQVASSPYAITASNAVGTGLSNYTIHYVDGGLTINPASLTVTAGNASKVYGDTLSFLGTEFTHDALLNGDTITGVSLASAGAAATATVNGGTPYAITASNAVGSGLTNYDIHYISGGLTVTPAALTVTANDLTKTYGATLTFAGTEFSTNGLVNSDSVTAVSLSSSGAAGTATVNGGTPYAISASNAVGTGLDNYTISYVSGGLTINPATLTITAGNASKTYGDTLSFAGTEFSTDGLVNSDSVTSVSLSSSGAAGTATVNGGTPYAIAASNAVGSGLSNYTVSYVDGGLTVNPAALTITASNATKTYGDTLNFAGTEFTHGTLFNGDTITSVGLTSDGAAGTATVNGGTPYAITASNAAGSGLSNYTISYVDGGLTINPATLTVTANDLTKTYGTAASFAGTEFSTDGLLNSDSVTSVSLTSAGAGATATVNGGTPYAITASNAAGSGLSNYAISYVDGGLTINPAALTITANSLTKTYGDTVTFAGTEFSIDGLKNSDGVTSVSLSSAGAGATAQVSASPYAISASNAAGTGLSNYTISYVDGGLTINPASLTVTANGLTKTYGDVVSFAGTEFSTDGLLNSDTVTSVSLTSAGAAGNAGVAASPYAITASNAVGSGLSNYTISYAGGELTVNPMALTVVANSGQSKIYGDADSALGYQITAGHLVGGDALSGALTRDAGENVGTYAITQGSLAASSNYLLTYAGATFAINPMALTVAATSGQSKTYGDADPTLGYQITTGHLVGSDALSGALSRDSGENAGSYAITQGNLAASSNYRLTFAAGTTFAINPMALTVSATGQTKVYGASDPSLGYQITTGHLVGSDALSGALARSAGETVGDYAITQGSLAASSNYTLAFVPGSLTITPAALTVTSGNASKTYGDAASLSGYSVSGLVSGDSVSGVSLASNGAAATAGVGSYAITASAAQGSGLSNYTITYLPGTLGVAARPLTVTIANASKVYGAANPVLTASASGLVNGDTLSGTAATSATQASHVGSYVITPGTLSVSANYIPAFVNGTLVITPAGLTVTANNVTAVTLDSAQPTASFTGLVNGDTSTVVSGLQFGLFEVSGTSYTVVPFGASARDYSIVYAPGLLTLIPDQPSQIAIAIPPQTGKASGTLTIGGQTVAFTNVATAAIGTSGSVTLFQIGGVPGQLGGFTNLVISDYSNATNENDRLVQE